MKTTLKPAPWSKAAPKLVDALKEYQEENGLKVDGVPGIQTIDQFLIDWIDGWTMPDDPGYIPPKPKDEAPFMLLIMAFTLGGMVGLIF